MIVCVCDDWWRDVERVIGGVVVCDVGGGLRVRARGRATVLNLVCDEDDGC